MSQAVFWGENVPYKRNRKCKGPEVGMYLECSGNSQQARAAGAKGAATSGGRIRGQQRRKSCEVLAATVRLEAKQ